MSNTGPLIALAKVDHLAILKALFGRVSIPPAVHRELLGGSGEDVARLQAALGDFIDTHSASSAAPANPPALARRIEALGDGEAAAIVLALQLGAVLVIDDQAARVVALDAGLPVTGTAGVLIQAKAVGLISAVRPVLQAMRSKGYWLSDGLLVAAARLAGE